MNDFRSLRRTHFFTGKFLSAEDLERDQDYVVQKFRRHNQLLHGIGVVIGLNVTTISGQIVIEPGLALDCSGNEIVVESRQVLTPASVAANTIYLSIQYDEEGLEPVPTSNGRSEPSLIRESLQFVFGTENHNRGHRHTRGRWVVCGQHHALTIAKLRRVTNGWRVDRRYRPPVVK